MEPCAVRCSIPFSIDFVQLSRGTEFYYTSVYRQLVYYYGNENKVSASIGNYTVCHLLRYMREC